MSEDRLSETFPILPPEEQPGEGEQAGAPAVPSLPAAPPPRAWPLRSIKERGWGNRDPEPLPALLVRGDDLAMPRGEVVMLVGAGGMGKSMATMQLAISIASGKPWLGFTPSPSPSGRGAVVLVSAEDSDHIMHIRYKNCAAKMQLRPDQMASAEALIVPMSGDEGTPHLVAQMRGAVGGAEMIGLGEDMLQLTAQLTKLGEAAERDGGLALIILDPAVKFMPPEGEERAAIASRFIDALKSWTRDLPGKPTVLLIHHTTKSARSNGGHNAESARGSSSLTDSVRCQFNLYDAAKMQPDEEHQEQLFLSISKNNYGPHGVRVALVRDPETGALGVAEKMQPGGEQAGQGRTARQDHHNTGLSLRDRL